MDKKIRIENDNLVSILRLKLEEKVKEDYTEENSISEETASKIDEEIKSIIDNAYNIGKEILTANTEKLHSIAKVLIEREKISGEEFETIMKG